MGSVLNSPQVGISDYSLIRINQPGGGIRYIELEPTDWHWRKRDNGPLDFEADLAIADVTDYLPYRAETLSFEDDITFLDESSFITPDFLCQNNIGIGDQTIMIGLFADHQNAEKNVPVGRLGNIAATPDGVCPVRLGLSDRLACPSFLNDMRSRSGFSGSPVWFWRSELDDMNTWRSNGEYPIQMRPLRALFRLIGIHRGQFRERATLQAAESETVLRDGSKVDIASSMTVVIPAWNITTLLDADVFEHMRQARDASSERLKIYQTIQDLKRAEE